MAKRTKRRGKGGGGEEEGDRRVAGLGEEEKRSGQEEEREDYNTINVLNTHKMLGYAAVEHRDKDGLYFITYMHIISQGCLESLEKSVNMVKPRAKESIQQPMLYGDTLLARTMHTLIQCM